jgi:8-oxo-dGTP diphosphatase
MGQVVGVALVEGGRVLAARRSAPSALAGLWEFPGGKVEPGEDPEATAVREISEELGCTIEVTGWLEGETTISEDLVLRVATARLVRGDPVPGEHDAVRWLRADQLGRVAWPDADMPFLGAIRVELGGRTAQGVRPDPIPAPRRGAGTSRRSR